MSSIVLSSKCLISSFSSIKRLERYLNNSGLNLETTKLSVHSALVSISNLVFEQVL